MKINFLKRIISLTICCTIVIFCMTCACGTAAAVEPPEPVQSPWAMTVPQIRVATELGNGTTLEKADGYQNAAITITDTDGSVLSDTCLFKVRGNTTALSWIKKKSFNFKFEKKKDVLGLGKGKKWALVANAFDPTLLRNYTAFSLAKELGLAYTSNFKMTELWVDGVFRGCYLLAEPVQEGKDRVDIDIESNGGKKDFLIEYEANRVEEDVTYFKVYGLRFIASEPETPDDEQLAYISNTLRNVIDVVANGTREEAAAVIDIESFAKFYVLNEYLKTFDLDTSSVFYYYKNGKLYAGPAWDYDLSSGNGNPEYGRRGMATYDPEGVFANDKNLFRFITVHDWFTDEVKKVYHDHYEFICGISQDGGFLDKAYAEYAAVFSRNYREANWVISKWWINIQMKPFGNYEQNFDYLKNWCRLRNEWMTEYYGAPEPDFIKGDADGDGVVNINDVTMIQRCLSDIDISDRQGVIRRGDTDGDLMLTINDATIIQRRLAEFTDD